jgi:hypothetical protein
MGALASLRMTALQKKKGRAEARPLGENCSG